MMNKEKILSRIKKLYELSLRGIDGEKKNAEAMMNDLMLKYDISIEDIKDEKKSRRLFFYKSLNHKDLLCQIVFMIVRDYDGTYWKVRGGGAMTVELTDFEFVEVSEYYEVYSKELSKEIKKAREMTYKAFVHKNKIFSDCNDNEDEQEGESMSLSELLQLQAMIDSMDKVNVIKKISS